MGDAGRHRPEDLSVREVFPGFHGRFVHSATRTFVWRTVDKPLGCPSTAMLDGCLALTVDGVEQVLRAGDVVAIPGGTRHAARALSPCRVLDVLCPVREDYR